MGDYEQLKQAVAAVVKTNGREEITGQNMQDTLLSIINSVGANATFAGVATPATNPGTPDANVFYIAGIPGEYVNFPMKAQTPTLKAGEIAVIMTKSGFWDFAYVTRNLLISGEQTLTDEQKSQVLTNLGAQAKQDEALQTTSKDIVGAINEVKQTADKNTSVIDNAFIKRENLYKGGTVNGYIQARTGKFTALTDDDKLASDLIVVKPDTYYYLNGRNKSYITNAIRCLKSDGTTSIKVLNAESGTEGDDFYIYGNGEKILANGMFKTPADAAFIQFQVRYNSLPETDFTHVVLEEVGDVYIPDFVPMEYGEESVILKEDVLPQIISELPAKVESLDIRVSALEKKNNSNILKVKKAGNKVYIASPYDQNNVLVKEVDWNREITYDSNANTNFVKSYLAEKDGDISVSQIPLKEEKDDVSPISLQATTMGGNHSFSGLTYEITSTNHGKTFADIASVYTDDNSIEFVLLKIQDENKLWVCSKNQSSDFTYNFKAPSGNLIYKEGGESVSNITVESFIKISNAYGCVVPKSKILKIDGTEIQDDGDYYGNKLEIEESYDCLDLPSVLANLIRNRPVSGYTENVNFANVANAEFMFRQSNVFSFFPSGTTLINTTIHFLKQVRFNYIAFTQASRLLAGKNEKIYMPKTKEIEGYDFTKLTDYSAVPASQLIFTQEYWENPLSPPDRAINKNDDISIAYGFVTDRGDGAIEKRKDNALTAFLLNSGTGKIYPYGRNKGSLETLNVNDSLSCIAYRCYTNPNNNPIGRTNYSEIELPDCTFIMLDYHGAITDIIPSKDNWIGRKIEVYESNDKCKLIGNIVNNNITVVSTADVDNYGFIILKIV